MICRGLFSLFVETRNKRSTISFSLWKNLKKKKKKEKKKKKRSKKKKKKKKKKIHFPSQEKNIPNKIIIPIQQQPVKLTIRKHLHTVITHSVYQHAPAELYCNCTHHSSHIKSTSFLSFWCACVLTLVLHFFFLQFLV